MERGRRFTVATGMIGAAVGGRMKCYTTRVKRRASQDDVEYAAARLRQEWWRCRRDVATALFWMELP